MRNGVKVARGAHNPVVKVQVLVPHLLSFLNKKQSNFIYIYINKQIMTLQNI